MFKKIRKSHVDWQKFLCGVPARDYIFQKASYEEQIEQANKLLRNADAVIIGAGAGASTAAGIQYGGKRFTENFSEFIKKYGSQYMTDMYDGFCLIRLNMDEAVVPESFGDRAIGIGGDMAKAITDLRGMIS